MTNERQSSPIGLPHHIPYTETNAAFWFLIGACFALACVDLYLTFWGL